MTFQPLSRRTRGLQPDGPFEGVPSHLRPLLVDWFEQSVSLGRSWNLPLLRAVGASLRLTVDPDWSAATVVSRYLATASGSEEFFLDLVDCVLAARFESPHWDGDVTLDGALTLCASVWQVNEAGDGLERRVGEELSETVAAATSPNDEASNHLREAWANAYGRNGNPSDAWDHGIKAVECLLCPVVVPKKDKPTLGDVLGVLRRNDGDKWRGSLPGKDKDHPVAPVVGALDLLWPNPDRHGEVNPRPPTEEEARTVVAVVAALVQAHRETPLVYPKKP